ncbi:hypothetical protein [Streptomyces coeruleorubidus]|uniref:hypothetical protein n=1 Tax=Streptomyces coeruleorubidus TaxID=116188 RepID=UPI00367DDA4A
MANGDGGGAGTTDVGDVAKLLAALVALGTAAFGLIGATTGELALLFRNKPGLTTVAFACGLALIFVTALVAMRPKGKEGWEWWQWGAFVGCFLLVVGVLGFLFWAKKIVQTDRVRPTVTAEWEMIGSSAAVKIATEADDVAETHVLWVGVTSGGDTLYSGATGPDVDGKAKQTAKVVVPAAVKESVTEESVTEESVTEEPVTIAAAIVEKTDSPVDGNQKVSCFGSETAIPPASSTSSVSPIHDPKAPQAACIALTYAPAPVPAPTAS